MKIIDININDLKEYENNPRIISQQAIDKVAKSIKEFGFKVPVIVDRDNVIITGHTRVKACKELGIKNIPCIIASDFTEEQVKAFRIADNKVSEVSKWDFDPLYEELEALKNLNIDLELTGFDMSEIEKMFSVTGQYIDSSTEIDINSFDDENFKHECPKCGFKYN